MNLPTIVPEAEWRDALDSLRVEEKAATRMLDALAAKRRQLPMVAVDSTYTFEGPAEARTLLELFEGRRQLVVHHFMFAPEWDAGCVGCSMFADGIGNLAHLRARDVTYVMISRAPYAKLAAFKTRMGWTMPWYSSHGSDFNRDMGVTTEQGEDFAVSVFLRDGDRVYRTYVATSRGGERLTDVWALLDSVPFGRQESWEASPPGWPQGPPYQWWRFHDEYDSPAT